MSRSDFDAAVAVLEESGLAVRQQRYEHETMGSWLVIAEGPGGAWMLSYDGRDSAFVTQRETAPGIWGKACVDATDKAFAAALRRVAFSARG